MPKGKKVRGVVLWDAERVRHRWQEIADDDEPVVDQGDKAYKGRKRHPVTIETRMTPELIEALAVTEFGAQAYVSSRHGRPYTIESFGNSFSKWCGEAGLPHCSCHGLRKAASVAYAESGATAPELMALFGWTNLRTTQIYIEKAQKRVMARNAAERLQKHKDRESVSLSSAKTPSETNEEKSDA